MSQFIKTPQPAPGGPSPGPATRGNQRSSAALWCLILGILSLLCFGPILGIPSLILGLVSLNKIKASDGQLTGKVLAIIGICLAVIGTTWGSYRTYNFVKEIQDSEPGDYQKTRFEIAESNIRSKSGDQIGFGNTAEAAALADGFASKMKLLRESFFTGESKGGLSGGEFLTHCELNEDRCAFIVHVPGLRKFEDDAKDSLCEMAWTIAQTTLRESDLPDGSEIVVGVKGFALYEDIMLGNYVKEGDARKRSAGTDKEQLKRFFPEPPAPPAVEPESGEDEDEGEGPAEASERATGSSGDDAGPTSTERSHQ